MKITVVAVGKVKERPLRALLDDYFARIARYARFREIELKDASAAELEARIARAIEPRGQSVALEVEGEAWSSHDLAAYIGRAEDGAIPSLTFLIGGAYGLPPAVSCRADHRLSLGRMTLPHRLARLVLAEQIYRGFTILRGEPYSH